MECEIFSRLNVFKCEFFIVQLYQLENVHKVMNVFHKVLLYFNNY